MEDDFDVVIVGGGIAGAALALALARAGVTIAVIERKTPRLTKPGDSVGLRVSAISPASQRLLDALDVWNDIEQAGVSPYSHMEVWDSGGTGKIEFDRTALNLPQLGYIVGNALIQTALWKALQGHPSVTVRCPEKLRAFKVRDHDVEIQLNGGSLKSRLLVGADGSNSRVRSLAGINTQRWDYHQEALVTHVSTARPHNQTCYQRFLPKGPLAFLPLRDGRSSIVWSTTTPEAQKLKHLPNERFIERLEHAIESRLGALGDVGPRATFPLRFMHAKQYVKSRIALIGDAAHVVHPLAGQGLNLGLLDAAALAEIIVEARSAGRDPGAIGTLRRYERRRKGDNTAMANMLHGLKFLFATQSTTVTVLRNAGLNLIDGLEPLKRSFIRQAAGLNSTLPQLMRRQRS